MNRVRLADIAEKVGVSIKTVSNVVNGTGFVSDAMRARILEVIDEMGYRPNAAARQLRRGSSGLLGLCVPDLRGPYFAEFSSAFIAAAQQRDLTVLVTQTDNGDRQRELAAIEGEHLPAVDGIVLSTLSLTADDLARRRSSVPLVLIGEHGEDLATDTIPHVGPDNFAAAANATRYALDQGRTRIAAIGLEAGSAETARVRFDGYRHALAEAGIEIDPTLLIEVGNYNRSAGSHAVEQLLESTTDFDAIFCFSDTLAFGALHTLGMRGIAVPEQVLVMGFDNIDESKFTVPPLITVDSGLARSSSMIIDLLMAGSDASPGGRIVIPHELMVR
jgi:DNA-binding LacI/PurR family transcriptional regulator